MQRRKYPRTSGLRQKRSVVEIGSRPKRDTLPTPPGDHPSLAGSPSRLENTHVAKMGKGVREFDWLPPRPGRIRTFISHFKKRL